jgi:hypothetical protein
MPYVIWDLDNCLADDSHRLHLINWNLEGDARYDAYNAASYADKPAHLTEYNLLLKLGCTPVFLTNRPEKWRGITSSWMTRNLPKSLGCWLLMRPNGAVYPPAVAKRLMLWEFFQRSGACPADVVGAFDDMQAILNVYDSYGIPTVRLAIHDSAAAYSPPKAPSLDPRFEAAHYLDGRDLRFGVSSTPGVEDTPAGDQKLQSAEVLEPLASIRRDAFADPGKFGDRPPHHPV